MHFYLTRCDITSVSDNLYSVEILFKSNKIEFQPQKKKKKEKEKISTKFIHRMILSSSVTQSYRKTEEKRMKEKSPISYLQVPPFPPPKQCCLKLVTILLTPSNTESGEREMEIKVLGKKI